MKRIDIVIPTRNRVDKLERTILTIPVSLGIDIFIHIIFDGDVGGANKSKVKYDKFKDVFVYLIPTYAGAVQCRNHLIKNCSDGVLYATDDMEFYPDAIKNAFTAMEQLYPDGDGVIGFHQEGNKYNPAGVALVGQKFLQRYPGKQLFYPGYFHFACQEVFWLASKYNKFHLEKSAVIKHFHPCNDKSQMDQTHIDARVHKKEDMELMKARKANGLIWGDG